MYRLTVVVICLWGWMKSEVCKRDELLAVILDAAARTNEREAQLRRTTRDLRTRVAKCTEVEGGILENVLRTVTDFSFEH